jgi:DtxR family transcriptional regulator, Mn-dependent transcriptional regulator
MTSTRRSARQADVPRCGCTIELTASVEDYLKAILRIGDDDSSVQVPVTVAALTRWLGVAPSSVTVMTDRLVHHRLAIRPARGRVTLTPHGRAHALTIVRRHRLMETYLHRRLGLAVDEVHCEAEVLEHAMSPRLEDRLSAVLGHPDTDPHGSRIPRPVQGLEGPL